MAGKKMIRLLVLFTTITAVLFQFSCAQFSLKGEKAPLKRKGDRIAEDYYNMAMEAIGEEKIAYGIEMLLKAQTRDPGNREIKDALGKVIGSLGSEVFYKQEIIRKGKGLSKPLQFILFYDSKDKRTPVSDVTVDFQFLEGNGVLTGQAVTNDLGIAKCYVEDLSGFKSSVVIEAKVMFSAGESVLEPESLRKEFSFRNISLFDVPHRLIMHVKSGQEVKKEYYPNLCNEVLRPFLENGFSVVTCNYEFHRAIFERAFDLDRPSVQVLKTEEGAEIFVLFLITGGIISKQTQDFFMSQAHVSMKIVDTETYALLHEVQKTETGAGPSDEASLYRAILNALARINEDIISYVEELRRTYGL
jgi:hypothetical protein